MLLYTATSHATYPHKTGEMLAYIASILQTRTNYPVEACLSYDRVFRAQAHLKPQFNWASDNTQLWNDKFLGRAAPRPCSTCSSISHSSHECHQTSAEVKTSNRPDPPQREGDVHGVQPVMLFHHCLSQTPSLLRVPFLHLM